MQILLAFSSIWLSFCMSCFGMVLLFFFKTIIIIQSTYFWWEPCRYLTYNAMVDTHYNERHMPKLWNLYEIRDFMREFRINWFIGCQINISIDNNFVKAYFRVSTITGNLYRLLCYCIYPFHLMRLSVSSLGTFIHFASSISTWKRTMWRLRGNDTVKAQSYLFLPQTSKWRENVEKPLTLIRKYVHYTFLKVSYQWKTTFTKNSIRKYAIIATACDE